MSLSEDGAAPDEGVDLTLAEMREAAEKEEAQAGLEEASARVDAGAPDDVDDGAEGDADPSRDAGQAYKRVKSENAELKDRIARMEGAFQQLVTQQAAQAQAPKETPAEERRRWREMLEDDPQAALERLADTLDQTEERHRATKAERERQDAALQSRVQQVSAINTQLAPTVQAFMERNPDYPERMQALHREICEQIAFEQGVRDPQALDFLAQEQIARVAARAVHHGRDPAEALYRMASPYAPANAEGESPEQKSARLNEGAKRETRLGKAGGRATKPVTNLSDLSKLKGDDFWKQWNSIKKQYGSTA